MSPLVVFLILGGAISGLIDWWAVWAERVEIERWAKPLTMTVLVALAAIAGAPTSAVRATLIIGAVCGLAGDIALLGDTESRFMIGLGSFAVGHVSYSVAALMVGFDPAWAVGGLIFVIALLGYRFVGQTLPGARQAGGPVLAGAVVFYAVVISMMTITAWATTFWLIAVGAMLFAVSDWVLGYRRFVGPLPGGRLGVMIPYHVGQTLLIVGLATA